ncbi:hypothetical protein ACJMK2_019492 [Sinanodonta woodiana]|uniref:KIAA0930 n=1 Tax=Sinanodonta woodiana TaxID=1069815 RepID=A0ABD3TX96_SINWO
MAEEEEGDSQEGVKTKPKSSLRRMLSTVNKERAKDKCLFSISGDFELVETPSRHSWTVLFSEYFLDGSRSPDDTRDDMLFYVRKVESNSGRSMVLKPKVEVYRRDSKKLPSLGETSIDWEETVYLNIILQQFRYTLTCAVCTRTGSKDLQALKKYSHRVYPSPSRRRMDSKGTEEEICYPNIFFSVDNFEEAFADIIVRDCELVTVELVAEDKDGTFQGVIFLGSIRYEALKKVYDARASLTSRMVQKMSMGLFKGHHKRVEFVRMRGPHAKGYAEMAVSRVKGSGPETPDLENFPVDDFDDPQQEQNKYTQRRMSDPSAAITSFVHGARRAMNMRKSQSDINRLDFQGGPEEVEAGTLHDELASTEQYNGFWGKSFGQAWHWFKEKRRSSSVALNAYLTYVTLPWHQIIADVLEVREQPVLLF